MADSLNAKQRKALKHLLDIKTSDGEDVCYITPDGPIHPSTAKALVGKGVAVRGTDRSGKAYWMHDVRATTALVSFSPMRDINGEWVYLYIRRGPNYAREPSTPSIFHEPVNNDKTQEEIRDELVSRLEENISRVILMPAELMQQIANIHFPKPLQ